MWKLLCMTSEVPVWAYSPRCMACSRTGREDSACRLHTDSAAALPGSASANTPAIPRKMDVKKHTAQQTAMVKLTRGQVECGAHQLLNNILVLGSYGARIVAERVHVGAQLPEGGSAG